MGVLVASWEHLSTDDIGPGTEGKRRVKVTAVASLSDGTLRMVAARVEMTPDELRRWTEAHQRG